MEATLCGQRVRDMAAKDAVIIPPSSALSRKQACEYQQLRSDGELIDFVIISHGREFPCHRVTLAASSPYLKALVTSGMEESTSRQVTLNDIPPAVVELLLEHMYHNKVTVPNDLLRDTIIASDYLHLHEMKEMCIARARQVVKPSNDLLWWQLADQLNLEDLKVTCKDIFYTSLPQVSKSVEFLELSVDEVVHHLDAMQNTTVDPDDRLEATMDWVSDNPDKRITNMEDLIEKIQLMKCSIECLQNETKSRAELFRRCPSVLEKITQSTLQLAMEGGVRKQRNKTGGKDGSIVIIGGQEGLEPNKSCWKLTEDKRLEKVCEIPDGHDIRYAVCIIPYIGFAVSGGENSDKVSVYMIASNSWRALRNMPHTRSAHGAAFLRQRIYLFGGCVNDADNSTSVISLDPQDGEEWRDEADLPYTVQHPEVACVEMNGRVTPFLIDINTNRMFSLDMEGKQWIKRPKVPDLKCWGAKLLAVSVDTLFIAGGANHIFAQYCPDRDLSWQDIGIGSTRRLFSAFVQHRDILYLIGGSNKDCVKEYIQASDPDEARWSTCEWSLPAKLFNLHALVLNI